MVKLLLDYSADPNLKDNNDSTALHKGLVIKINYRTI